jgi:hypothetical protein
MEDAVPAGSTGRESSISVALRALRILVPRWGAPLDLYMVHWMSRGGGPEMRIGSVVRTRFRRGVGSVGRGVAENRRR